MSDLINKTLSYFNRDMQPHPTTPFKHLMSEDEIKYWFPNSYSDELKKEWDKSMEGKREEWDRINQEINESWSQTYKQTSAKLDALKQRIEKENR